MNIEPNKENSNERMMAYLYGELSSAEKNAFETRMESDAALKSSYLEFRETRELMGSLPYEAVNPPPFQQLMHGEGKSNQANDAFKWMGAIAASVLLILFAAKLMGLSIHSIDGQTTISFNNQSEAISTAEYIPKKEVNKMIAASLTVYDKRLNQQMDARSAKQEKMINTQFGQNRDLLTGSVQKIQHNNKQLMDAYWQQSNQQQQLYMASLMGNFTNYVEQKRNEDMQYLMAKINLLETDTDLLELETNELRNSYAINTQENSY